MELGMELMGKNLGGGQAGSVTWAFVELQHPHLVENEDCRIPSVARFREWRMFSGPICHFIAVSTIRAAVRVHLTHDATKKRGDLLLPDRGSCGDAGWLDRQVSREVRPAAVRGRRGGGAARPGVAAHRPREWVYA